MNNLIVYKCLDCGHYNISNKDGRICAKCNGPIAPMGEATNIDKSKLMTVNVSLKDTDIFKESIALLKEIAIRKDTSQDIKDKILKYANEINDPNRVRIIVCQSCGALLVTFDNKGNSRIHLKSSNISIGDNRIMTLKCNCGCEIQYKEN